MRFSFVLDWPNDSLLFDSYKSYLTHTAACPISQALSLLQLLTLFQWKEQGSGSLSPAGVTRRWHSQLCAPQSGQSEVKYCSRMQTQEDNSDLQYILSPCSAVCAWFSLFLNLFLGTQREITVSGELTVSGPFVQSEYRFVRSHRTTVYSTLRL